MLDTTTICAGIDVSKRKLDIVLHPTGTHLSVPYDSDGLRRLDGFLDAHGVARIGFEASGGYEWRLLAHLRGAGRSAARLQPGQVRSYARSRLQRAKNDRLDAALIAAFTAQLDKMPALPDARFDQLSAELTYLEQVEMQIVTLKTMAETTQVARLKRLHEKDVERLERRRDARMTLIAATLAGDATLARRLELVMSIRGIGLRTALALVIRLPELGSVGRQQIASLVGVAPFDDDSGARQGRRHVRAGRARLRKSLFMAAFSAAQWNLDLKAFYDRLRARGKHHLVATVAVARKLVILANAVAARQTPWTPRNP